MPESVAPPQIEYQDRKAGLIVFGILDGINGMRHSSLLCHSWATLFTCESFFTLRASSESR
jgi:hypothetical protein